MLSALNGEHVLNKVEVMMEVIGRLKIEGNSNAFLVKDAEVTYPVFGESLQSKTLFNQLVGSGYKLVGLPYDFKKDGVSIMSLPIKEYAPTDQEYQDMFDMNDMPRLSMSELTASISTEDVKYLDTPETDYTIMTREDFIKYLKSTKFIDNDNDFKPINYFVHPSARFTVYEWKSGKYQEYFDVMSSRRSMNYWKFRRLRDWLTQHGMPENGTEVDLCEAYCQWGIDGLNVRFINKNRKTMLIDEEFVNMPGMAEDAYELTRTETALVDRYGSIFAPEDIAPGYDGWKVTGTRGKESSAFKGLISGLKEGEFTVCTVRTKTTEDVLYYDGLKDCFKVTPYSISCGNTRMVNFRVTMPDVTAYNLPCLWWSKIYDKRVEQMSELRALAQSLIQQRKYTADVSTYKALLEIGCDAKGALMYVISGMNSQGPTSEDEEDVVIPTEADVDLYLASSPDMEEDLTDTQQAARDVILDIVNGVVNMDGIADGQLSDSFMNVEEIYKYLYAAHFCRTAIPISEIYEKIKDVAKHIVKHTNTRGETEDVLPLTSEDGFTINVPSREIRAKIDGYKADVRRYKVQQAAECCGFLRVVQIAKEFGEPSCDRHVAFEADTVNLFADRGAARANLDRLIEIFEEQLEKHVPLQRHAALRLYERATCMQEYFRVAETGQMKFTKEMGGETINVPMDLAIACAKSITRKITSTATYCAKMFDGEFLTHYCTNADITPWRIYPKGTNKIPAVSLPAVWYDWARIGNPQIAHKLISNGYLCKGFIPWCNSYYSNAYFNLEGMIPEANITVYMGYCNKFRESVRPNEEFIHAPHIETLFYNIFGDETVLNESSTSLRKEGELPALTVSVGEIVSGDTYKDYRKIEMVRESESEKTLRRFTGYTAEDFEMVPNIMDIQLPDVTDKCITVEGDTISTDISEEYPAYAVTQLVGTGYPVIRLYGRKYIFRDLFGGLWEVTA